MNKMPNPFYQISPDNLSPILKTEAKKIEDCLNPLSELFWNNASLYYKYTVITRINNGSILLFLPKQFVR